MRLSTFKMLFFCLFLTTVSCSDGGRGISSLTFQEAHKELLLKGVEVQIDFESFEDIEVNGEVETLPCVQIKSYLFFNVIETREEVDRVINAIKGLKQSLKSELNEDELSLCSSKGFEFDDLIEELLNCKDDIEMGLNCFS